MRKVIAWVTIASLTGCSTAPPNTPGAGAGATYTPFIDVAGVDPGRYESDLSGCRSYAQQIDPNKKAMEGMLGGMLLGALLGAAIGGNRYHTEQGALAGGGMGVAAGGSRAIVKQETIIANCMAGRGYRVLEGATVSTNTAVPSPYMQSQTPTAATHQAAAPAMTQASFSPAETQRPTGQDTYGAEKLAQQQACHTAPRAMLAGKGPGFEAYTVACSNGDTLMIRCEFGNCRALR